MKMMKKEEGGKGKKWGYERSIAGDSVNGETDEGAKESQ